MMEIKVSKIVNVVEFSVSKDTLKKAKDSVKGIKDFIENQKPVLKIGLDQKHLKKQVKQAVAAAQAQQKIINGVAGTSPVKTPGVSGKGNANGAARAQAQAIKMADTADIKRRSAALALNGITGRTVDEQYRAIKAVHGVTQQYEQGVISQARMNQLIKEEIALVRRAAAARRSVTQATQTASISTGGKLAGVGKGFMSGGFLGAGTGALASAGMAGGGVLAAGYLGERIRTAVTEQARDVNELSASAKSVNVDPNTILAMQRYAQVNGIDSGSDGVTGRQKLVDGMKDLTEKLNQSGQDSTFDKKSGKWKGGNSAIDTKMTDLGMSKEEIKQYSTSPADFMNRIVNGYQKKGLTPEQMSNKIESLYDDAMYYTKLWANNSAELSNNFEELKKAGGLLTIEQQDAAKELARTMSLGGAAMDSNLRQMMVGFTQAFGNSDDFVNSIQKLGPAFKELGSETGNLIKNITMFATQITDGYSKFMGWLQKEFPSVFKSGDNSVIDSVNGMVSGSADGAASWVNDVFGFDPRNVGRGFKGDGGYSPNVPLITGNNAIPQSYQPASYSAPNITVLPAQVMNVIDVKPDYSRMGQFIDLEVTSKLQAQADQLAIDLQGATSASGN
ncbi:hypothetical protein MC52_021525 [Klebsiella michiganensis]|uniref:hypothetical protein n=1 Tax=Klebsiella michiganensis TaxID=1134687 RepID=UPI00053871A9|nr:hypothetical protein [Klebsiella michiganensis]PNO44933.1 hypothetical protein MC52_021525 [Klebsiella michiganensis]